MTALRQLEPGWLARSIASAHRRLHVVMTPQDLVNRGLTVTLPLPADEQAQLFNDINQHFEVWTGKTLADHLRAQSSPNTETTDHD